MLSLTSQRGVCLKPRGRAWTVNVTFYAFVKAPPDRELYNVVHEGLTLSPSCL